MIRYEFAAMLDSLMRSGVTLDSKIAKEFEPELGRIYVERISGQDKDRKKVERVRVNNSDSKYPEGKNRDAYGSKIVTGVPAKAEVKEKSKGYNKRDKKHNTLSSTPGRNVRGLL